MPKFGKTFANSSAKWFNFMQEIEIPQLIIQPNGLILCQSLGKPLQLVQPNALILCKSWNTSANGPAKNCLKNYTTREDHLNKRH